MEIKIKRKEATISSDTIEIPAQGSANIPVVLENDSSYSNYIKEVHCGYYLNGVYCKIILPIENEKYLIPLEAFESSGPLYLAVALVNVKEIIKTNQINFEVRAAPNGKVILPTENEWHILVKNYMDSLFENDFGDRFDEIGTNLEELAAEAEKQQNKAAEQQTALDNKLNELSSLEETVSRNETVRQKNETKRQNDTANAVKKCNDTVDEINIKLENGDFIGAVGATPKISIGNVTTGNPGITIHGTPEAPVLDFTMPSAGDLSYATDADIDEMIVEVFG